MATGTTGTEWMRSVPCYVKTLAQYGTESEVANGLTCEVVANTDKSLERH